MSIESKEVLAHLQELYSNSFKSLNSILNEFLKLCSSQPVSVIETESFQSNMKDTLNFLFEERQRCHSLIQGISVSLSEAESKEVPPPKNIDDYSH